MKALITGAGGFIGLHLAELLVKSNLKIRALSQYNSFSGATERFSFAVVMAVGKGTRLRPLTEAIPKPMVEVGGVPLLQRQIQKLVGSRISRIYIAINYLGDVIERHFGNGAALGAEIVY
jgi:hypothetical protein